MALGVITSFSVQQRITLKRAFMWSAVTMMYTSYIAYIVQLTKASHWYRNIFMRYTMSVFNPYKVRGEKHTSSAFQFENDEDQLTSLWRQCQTGFTVWCSLFSICLFCKKDICNTERNNTLFSLILSNRFFFVMQGSNNSDWDLFYLRILEGTGSNQFVWRPFSVLCLRWKSKFPFQPGLHKILHPFLH